MVTKYFIIIIQQYKLRFNLTLKVHLNNKHYY